MYDSVIFIDIHRIRIQIWIVDFLKGFLYGYNIIPLNSFPSQPYIHVNNNLWQGQSKSNEMLISCYCKITIKVLRLLPCQRSSHHPPLISISLGGSCYHMHAGPVSLSWNLLFTSLVLFVPTICI